MNRWINRGIVTAGLAAGAWLLTAAPAHADTTDQPTNNSTRATATLRVNLNSAIPNPRIRLNPTGATAGVQTGTPGRTTARLQVSTPGSTLGGPTGRTTGQARVGTPGVTARARIDTAVRPAADSARRGTRPATVRIRIGVPRSTGRATPGRDDRNATARITATAGNTTGNVVVRLAPANRIRPTTDGAGRALLSPTTVTAGATAATDGGIGVPRPTNPASTPIRANGDVCVTLGGAAGCQTGTAPTDRSPVASGQATVAMSGNTEPTGPTGGIIQTPPASAALHADTTIQRGTGTDLAASGDLCLTVGATTGCGPDTGPTQNTGPTTSPTTLAATVDAALTNPRTTVAATIEAALTNPPTTLAATVAAAANGGAVGTRAPAAGLQVDAAVQPGTGTNPGTGNGTANGPGSGGQPGWTSGDGPGGRANDGTTGNSAGQTGGSTRNGGAVGAGGLTRLPGLSGAPTIPASLTRAGTTPATPLVSASSIRSGGQLAGRLPRTGAVVRTILGAGIAMVLIGLLLGYAGRRRRV